MGQPNCGNRIAYVYTFNNGEVGTKCELDGKERVITGADIKLMLRIYDKDGNEILFADKEPHITFGTKAVSLSEAFDVRYDADKQFVVMKDFNVHNILHTMCDYIKIEADIAGYYLDYADCLVKDTELGGKLPANMQDIPVDSQFGVTEKVMRDFMAEHPEGFNISDNVSAQCIGVEFMNAS